MKKKIIKSKNKKLIDQKKTHDIFALQPAGKSKVLTFTHVKFERNDKKYVLKCLYTFPYFEHMDIIAIAL